MIVVDTIDIKPRPGDCGKYMIIKERWALIVEHITEEDLKRLLSRKNASVKVRSVDKSGLVVFVEAPQSPPDLRCYPGPIIRMGFESQEWGRYPWLD